MKKYLGGAKLYQFPNVSPTQMMCYALEYQDKLLVFDGGNLAEADFLESFLKKYKRVDGWFITHGHADHIDCVTEIIKRENIKVDKLYFNFDGLEEIYQAEYNRQPSLAALVATKKLKDALKGKKIEVITPKKGDIYDFGDIKVKALTQPDLNLNRGFIGDPVNNLGVVYKIFTLEESVLILGDLAEDVGKILMEDFPQELATSAVVQMSHHGQRGVTEEFYRFISPKVCLWPAPGWLYDNLGANGFDSGPYLTVRTREWTEKLNVEMNLVAKDGLIVLE